jgi:hypothetical protein
MAPRSDLKRELDALRTKKGVFHAERAHDWAADHPDSLLYKALEWNDKKAGYQYRLQQIRKLVEIHCVDSLGRRELVSLSIDRYSGGGYRPATEVYTDKDLREIALSDACDDLARLERLYQNLTELGPVWRLVQTIRSGVGRKKSA